MIDDVTVNGCISPVFSTGEMSKIMTRGFAGWFFVLVGVEEETVQPGKDMCRAVIRCAAASLVVLCAAGVFMIATF